MPVSSKRAVIIAGTGSGCGKTTVTLALLALLGQQGLRVQPFKVGPDYLDTGWHSAITPLPSRNLDNFMLPDDAVRHVFRHAMNSADIGVIEGVMGMFDGLGKDPMCCSTAGMAQLLGCPVILLVDGKSVSTSLAATVKGFNEFVPGVRISGVLINRVNSDSHFQLLKEAVEHYCRVPVLGYIPQTADIALPSRHLGLVGAGEVPFDIAPWQALAARLTQTINVNALLACCHLDIPPSAPTVLPDPALGNGLTLALARDEAFSFYYQDNLDLLENAGVRIVPFSPLHDTRLPPCQMVWLGGGYPELYAGQLAGNLSMLASLRACCARGTPVYAECGGLMYLGRTLTDQQQQTHTLAGIIDGHSRMGKRLTRFGYCEARARTDTLLAPAGDVVRGHEFHYSDFETALSPVLTCTKQRDGQVVRQWEGGWQVGNTFASYLHVHFGQAPQRLNRWLQTARSVL